MTAIEQTAQKMIGTDEQWRDTAKGMLKAELKRQNLTYADLAKRLAAMGIDETETSVRNKIGRGSFSFVFALQAMTAIGVRLRLSRTEGLMEMNLPQSVGSSPVEMSAAVWRELSGREPK